MRRRVTPLGTATGEESRGVRRRLRMLQQNSPSDFETDNEFFNFQECNTVCGVAVCCVAQYVAICGVAHVLKERQAALIGASLHAMLHNYSRHAGNVMRHSHMMVS